MERTRAYRRHQSRRAKNRAKRFLKICDDQWVSKNVAGESFKLSESDRHINLYAKNRKPCSCYCCRNEKYNRIKENEDSCRTIMLDTEHTV
jgi:hypothetical protein